MSNSKSFVSQLLDALIHFFYRIVYFLFILPFGIWKSAVIRLSEQRSQKSLDMTHIKTEWPFLSFLKRFCFEFFFDGLILISWIIGLIACPMILDDLAILGIIVAYYTPLVLQITKDLLVIFTILPCRWMISFFNRPAKTYDLTHTGKIVKE